MTAWQDPDWEWKGHTLMERHTIVEMLNRNGIKMTWVLLLDLCLVRRTQERVRDGGVYFAVLGGIGKFMDDCRITTACAALERPTPEEEADADHKAKLEYERRWKEPWGA